MWFEFIQYVGENRLGDLASIAGLAFSVFAFVVTIINVLLSKHAAVEAKTVAEKVREDMGRYQAVAELSSAITKIEEMKSLHRQTDWERLPEAYSTVRKSLVAIRGSSAELSEKYKRKLQGVVTQLANNEYKTEELIVNPDMERNVPELNRILSEQADNLTEILYEIRNRMGR